MAIDATVGLVLEFNELSFLLLFLVQLKHLLNDCCFYFIPVVFCFAIQYCLLDRYRSGRHKAKLHTFKS